MTERDLFLTALEIEDPAEREAFLQKECGDDAELLTRVEALLSSHEGQSQFLRTPVVEQMGDDPEGLTAATLQMSNDSTADEELDSDAFDSNPEDTMIRKPGEDDEIPLEPSSRPDSLGRLAHYEVLEVIGQGAFGTVLKAFDEQLHRVVAIKVMSAELAATSPARKRFSREARASAKVRHENVVSIYNVGETPIPYLVMEYIPGETLQQRLKQTGPLEVTEVLRLGTQMAYGLAAAHAEQLIHRDVKPGNILLDTSIEDKVKITDFGLARAADDASMTQSGVIAGTPLYMAPEQALGHKLDQRADLFSFGSVLYQMLGGRPPFRAPSTIAVLKRVVEDTPRPLTEIIPEIPEWMCNIVSRLHEKSPDDRFESAKEVGDLLQSCLTDLQQGRIPEVAAPASVVKLVESEQTQLRLRRDGRQTMRPAMKLVAVVLILLGGLAITEATGVTKFATTVIRLATGSGTLVIETDDPEVAIAIDGEEVTIRGGGVKELTLRPGDYTVAALKNGQQVKQELVSITRNGRTRLRLRLESQGETTSDIKGPFDDEVRWVKLFNGKDLTGWKVHPQQTNTWSVKDGVLVGKEGQSHLFTERGDYRDFELRLECRVSENGNSGVLLRSEFGFSFDLAVLDLAGRATQGLEVDIHPGTQPQPAGSVWQLGTPDWMSPASHQLTTPDEWFEMTILARGKHLSVKIDGQQVLDRSRNDVAFAEGHICLLNQRDFPESVEFRKIEIKELTASTSTAPPAIAPFTDADVQRIAALPAAEQIEEVRQELIRRNPGFDGKLTPKIQDDKVIRLSFHTDHVTDISPVRSLSHLLSLTAQGSSFRKGSLVDLSPLRGMKLTMLNVDYNKVRDLTPLRGMPLTGLYATESPIRDLEPLKGMPLEALYLWYWTGSDLTALEGMPLKRLNVGANNRIFDLAPLAGMPLEFLCLNGTRVSDLSSVKDAPLTSLLFQQTLISDISPLRGMKLKTLECADSRVSDLSPLDGMPLKELSCDVRPERDTEILRSIKTLETINDKPAVEFWKDVEQSTLQSPADAPLKAPRNEQDN